MRLLLNKLKFGIFLPISAFLLIWYLIVFVMIATQLWIFVVILCFQDLYFQRIKQQIIDYMLCVVLLIDIVISFNTGYIQNGRLVLDRKQIIKKYGKSIYIAIDISSLIACGLQITLSNIFKNNNANNTVQLPSNNFAFLNILILLKFFKISNLDTILTKYILKNHILLYIYQFCKTFLILIFICHIFGSFYFLLDVYLFQNGFYPKQMLWIYNSAAYQNIAENPLWIKHAYSFQFLLTVSSTIAYGDIAPLNPIQVLYTMFCLSIPLLVYNYFFQRIFKLFAVLRQQQSDQILIKKFLKENLGKRLKVDEILKSKIIYFVAYFYKEKARTQKSFFSVLSTQRKMQFQFYNMKANFDLSIFSNLHQNQQSQRKLHLILLTLIKQRFYSANYSFKKHNSLIYMNEGKIIQYSRLNKNKYILNEDKKFFGQYQFFTGLKDRRIQYQASRFIRCQIIQQKQFLQKIRQDRNCLMKLYFQLRKKIIFDGQIDLISQSCSFCLQKNHTMINCLNLKGNFQIGNSEQESLYFFRKKIRQTSQSKPYKRKVYKQSSRKIFKFKNKLYPPLLKKKSFIFQQEDQFKYKTLLSLPKDKRIQTSMEEEEISVQVDKVYDFEHFDQQ